MRALAPARSYQDLYESFRWRIPDCFNIGEICRRHRPDKAALLAVDEKGRFRRLTFGVVDRRANQLANALMAWFGSIRSGRRIVAPVS